MNITTLKKQLSQLPDNPGIYFFYDEKNRLIYVGKAVSLKSRVRSYFSGKKNPRPIEEMIGQVARIKYSIADSALEAAILEALTIKEKMPKYNALGKDDKSWNYLTLSKDEYPLIKTLRQHEYKRLTEKQLKQKYYKVFGPFPGIKTKELIKVLQKLFSFCVCKPGAKSCLYEQMHYCLGAHMNKITPREYKDKVINPLIRFLNGRKKGLLKSLSIKMRQTAKAQNFEEAGRLRNQIDNLRKIQDVTLLSEAFVKHAFGNEKTIRLEAYDISNLGASGKVGSLVVFDENGPLKQYYRRFKIKTVSGQSDVDCLKEVLRRRLKHDEWQLPDLFLIDGGKPQVNSTRQILAEYQLPTPVAGIAKGKNRKNNDLMIIGADADLKKWINEHISLLIQARDEAHRFAIDYQRKLRKLK